MPKRSRAFTTAWISLSSTEPMHPWAATLNGWIRKVPVWPGYVLLFLPFAWWLWRAASGGVADPINQLERQVGLFAYQLLLVSLMITPLLHQTRINLVRFRRMIGLMSFYYVVLHFAVYLFLDNQLVWATLEKDLTKRPYIMVGMLSLLVLIPVALTSNNWAVRRLSAKRWQRIHSLVYVAVIAAGLHFLWLSKVKVGEPMLYLLLAIGLVAYRVWWKVHKARTRARAPA